MVRQVGGAAGCSASCILCCVVLVVGGGWRDVAVVGEGRAGGSRACWKAWVTTGHSVVVCVCLLQPRVPVLLAFEWLQQPGPVGWNACMCQLDSCLHATFLHVPA